MAVLSRAVAAAAAVALLPAMASAQTAPASDTTGVCLDAQLKADLDAKRRRRSVKERLVQKANRHQLDARGGYYVSDAFEATGAVGGGYTYHLTEDFAVEASGLYTRITSAGGPELERLFSVLGTRDRGALLLATNLVYAPLHGKLQTGASIAHFDLFATIGAGVVDSALSSGVAGNAGIGALFFLHRAVALRVEVRDYVYRQQLLARKLIVNDVALLVGLSAVLPVEE